MMKASPILLIPVLAVAAACGGSGAETAEPGVFDSQSLSVLNTPDNATILAKAYDPDYSVPPGFLVDERAKTTTGSYTVHHVLDASRSYELCTNDLVVAQAWEQADNDARAVSGYYVASIENDRYFEFIRELNFDQDVGNVSNPTSPGYSRVFKCDYADRNGVDRNLLDGYSGRLSINSLDKGTLQEFTEYLWQFRFFNVARKIVVSSTGTQNTDGPTHTLLLAFVVNQGTGRCDRVDVIEWRFRAYENTHEVTREYKPVRSFEAEMIGGSPRFCD